MENLLKDSYFWTKAKADAHRMLHILHGALPGPPVQSHNSLCWKTTFKVCLKNGVLSVVLGKYYYSHAFSSGNDVINDTRAYYVNMLTDRMTEGVDTNYVCIPRIFLAGFPKSGSTFLADSVTSHTKIFNGMTKEPKWWVPTPRGPNNSPFKATVLYVAKYLLQYVDHSNWYAEQDSEVTLIDSSPNLIAQWSNIGIEETFEDACLLPAVFSTFLSNPHFIIIMRNPVEFLYSAFWCSCSSTIFHNYNLDTAEAKRGPNVFHTMVVRHLNEFQKCHKIFSVEQCILNQSFIVDKHPQDFHCGFVSLDFAVYYVHLVKWLSVFPRENFFFIHGEDFFKNPAQILKDIWRYLGLTEPGLSIYTLFQPSPNKNSQQRYNYHTDTNLQMLPETRVLLEEFFEPFNKILAELLNDRRFLYKEPTF